MGAVAGIGERVLVHLNFLPPGGRCMVQASPRASQFKVVVFLRACQSGRGEERREVCFEWGHVAGTGKRILLHPRSFQCSCRLALYVVGGARTCCGHKQASPRAFQFLPVCLFLHFRHRTEGEGVREVCFEWFGHRQANPRSPQFSVTCLFVHPVRVRCDLIGSGEVQAWAIPCAITIRLRSAVLAWSYACRDECAPSSRRS